MLLRLGKAIFRLLLNWGVLAGVIAVVLVLRHHAEAQARAPLPATAADIPVAQAGQWQHFPSYTRVVPVLVYHAINDGGGRYSVSPQVFAEQMLALKAAGFHAITLTQYVHFVYGDWRGLPPRPILLTFDDGRRDAYRNADGVLRKYGFSATMFTFAAWPVTNPGFALTWPELQNMRRSGLWSVQEHGGRGHEYVAYNSSGSTGETYAFLRYFPPHAGRGGSLEGFRSFVRRATSDILWGKHQFAAHLPGYQPLAFAVPHGNYGQQHTNDFRIPKFMLPWLRKHFPVVFGGDYLDQGPRRPYEIRPRFSREISYRITMGPKISLPALYCRLKDWVTGTSFSAEYGCMRLPSDVDNQLIHPARQAGGIFTRYR